jgi:hypothetical protein
MIRLIGAVLLATVFVACASLDCGWVVEIIDDAAHLSYVCNH